MFVDKGNECEKVVLPWIQADRSCEGIFPFTLKVPRRKLQYFNHRLEVNSESVAHVNLVRPFLDVSRTWVRIHSSLNR